MRITAQVLPPEPRRTALIVVPPRLRNTMD
jgi:hypothetical protein